MTTATPFYGEMGGQVGDVGTITSDAGLLIEVVDATRPTDGIIAHKGIVKKGALKVGERVTLAVDETKRNMTEANHSATHLLHTALRRVLGEHVKQAGSLRLPRPAPV